MRPPQRPTDRTDARSDRRSAPGDAATRPDQRQLPRNTPDRPAADRRSPPRPVAVVPGRAAHSCRRPRHRLPRSHPATANPVPPTSTGAAPAVSSPEAYRTPAARPSPPSVHGRHPITLNISVGSVRSKTEVASLVRVDRTSRSGLGFVPNPTYASLRVMLRSGAKIHRKVARRHLNYSSFRSDGT